MGEFLHVWLSKCVCTEKNNFVAGQIINNSKHCSWITSKLDVEHNNCNVLKSDDRNKMTCLNIDNIYVKVEKMCCLLIGKAIEEVADTRSLCVNIENELAHDNHRTLIICYTMRLLIVTKHNMLCNKVAGENDSLEVVEFEEDSNA